MGTKPAQSETMKQRVNRLLLKLSDRDTESMAAAELESMITSAISTPDELSAFVSAISDVRSNDKTPLRRHSLRLLSVVSATHHSSLVAPLVPRMLTSAIRRLLRDQDSSVRAAFVDACRSFANAVGSAASTASVVNTVIAPLTDAVLHEQDQWAQLAAALALAAAIESSSSAAAAANITHPTLEIVGYLQRLLPKLVKLVKSKAFKAKPALISVIGAAAAAGGAGNAAVAGVLVACLGEALGSEDWAARKAAAEALTSLAVREEELLGVFKKPCIVTFESRRFDKVKIVREAMNRMIEVWKVIPAVDDGEMNNPTPVMKSQVKSGNREITGNGRVQTASLRKSQLPSSRSPPPEASPIKTNRKTSPSIRNKRLSPPTFRKNDHTNNTDWKVEIAVPNDTPIKVITEEKLLKDRRQEDGEGNVRARLEARRMLFQKNGEEKGNKLTGKSGSRVMPYEGDASLEPTAEAEDGPDELNQSHKDDDLSMIRMQLVQIENQQTSLLDLLQKFIGSAQHGIHSLETRVHGLEVTLDEISRDLMVSSGRVANSDPDVNTCCILSPKFWRRHEGRYSSRYSVSDIQNYSEECRGSYKWERQRFGRQGGFVTNPLAEMNPPLVGTAEITSNETGKTRTQGGKK